jgi:AraC-like DNA-binding protein
MQTSGPSNERHRSQSSDLAFGKHLQPARKRTATLAPWQALRLKAHIETQLDSALRVSELAQLVRLSPRYFSAAFRGTFDQSPYDYLLHRRVTRACELMLGTREPLSQIALSCGFSDQAHLTHVFRARLGISPHAWRRAQIATRSPAALAAPALRVLRGGPPPLAA